MTVIYVSDFDLRGSGYMNIAVALCGQLVERGKEVIALGLGYNGQEHDHPFPIVPTRIPLIPHMISLLRKEVDVEAIVVALDIPLQEVLLDRMGYPGDGPPYIGLFPIEGPPVCMSWALQLSRMNERLVMSKFGREELARVGIASTYIPIGIDLESWRPAAPDERAAIRQNLGIDEDTFVVLTVADNQERKNLSRAMEIFAHFSLDALAVDKYGTILEGEEKHKTQWHLVTRPKSQVGWKLEDYAMQLSVMDRLMLYERGVPFRALWSLFIAADAFLLTSKAEGLAMPVLEAMACRLPVVATDCCAIREHLKDGRGILIEPDYVMSDPWGNSMRYMAGRDNGVAGLEVLAKMPDTVRGPMLDKASEYVAGRSWDVAGDVLMKAIAEATKGA